MPRNEDIRPTPDLNDRSTPVWAGFADPEEGPNEADSPYIYETSLVMNLFDQTLYAIFAKEMALSPDLGIQLKLKRAGRLENLGMKRHKGVVNTVRLSSSIPIEQLREIIGAAKSSLFIDEDKATSANLTREQTVTYTKAVREQISKEREKRANTPNPDIGLAES
ncbi:MAG TPA: hypothetical protein VG917_03680 [Patescibacteria group bacterium]|nr:hypothetical protein [Patescibacteria group bacterium]